MNAQVCYCGHKSIDHYAEQGYGGMLLTSCAMVTCSCEHFTPEEENA